MTETHKQVRNGATEAIRAEQKKEFVAEQQKQSVMNQQKQYVVKHQKQPRGEATEVVPWWSRRSSFMVEKENKK